MERSLTFACRIHEIQHKARVAAADSKKWTSAWDHRFLAGSTVNAYDRCAAIRGKT
jgi:hypothetical protein